MPAAQKEKNGTWTGRARCKGRNDSKSGFGTKKDAHDWARSVETEWQTAGQPKGVGPSKMTVARALLEMALIRLPFKKGARQEAGRINEYLRLAGLPLLWVTELKVSRAAAESQSEESAKQSKKAAKPKLIHCDIDFIESDEFDKRCAGAKGFMQRSDPNSASMRCRARIGAMKFDALRSTDVQELIEARKLEGSSAQTVEHDVAILRELFNNARRHWAWLPNLANPASKHLLDVPKVNNGRDHVLTPDEEARLVAAMRQCYDPRKLHAVAFLCATAMRCAEALETICWRDVKWDEGVIHLSENKSGGSRDVPVLDEALEVLRALPRGADDEPVFGITYEALRSSFKRACGRAGLEDFHLHDLRHTGLSGLSMRLNGYIAALQKISGHKTRSQLARYDHISTENTRALLVGKTPVIPGDKMLELTIGDKGEQHFSLGQQEKNRRSRAQVDAAARKKLAEGAELEKSANVREQASQVAFPEESSVESSDEVLEALISATAAEPKEAAVTAGGDVKGIEGSQDQPASPKRTPDDSEPLGITPVASNIVDFSAYRRRAA